MMSYDHKYLNKTMTSRKTHVKSLLITELMKKKITKELPLTYF